ncbi:hypothetical protein [Pseudomonas sp. NMI1173_11]|uniref:hypothetical protein n=1 Tax=Pseudomonas sp. NMI1173_11 TaxID=2903145 RepID=UPI00125D7A1B|nr:hypothetical protein [Pseudomonas sp. NMI1173_11]MCE0999947.1 hypothetical protein [Pseudomonas sp. NMI1173_11]
MKQREVIMPDYPIFTDALAALKRYHEALDESAPSEDVERLRLVAESLFKSATDYHLFALGHQPLHRH